MTLPQARVLASSAAPLPAGVQLRPGRPADRSTLWRLVLREKLNPLGLDPARFTVAERTSGSGGSGSGGGDASGGATIVGIGQLKPLNSGAALELASLVVEESERGRGVGSALVASLLERAGGTPVFLTTVSRRAALYRRCGFEDVPPTQVPPFLLAEYVIGLLVAYAVTRDRLVLMRRLPAGGGGASGAAGQQRRPER